MGPSSEVERKSLLPGSAFAAPECRRMLPKIEEIGRPPGLRNLRGFSQQGEKEEREEGGPRKGAGILPPINKEPMLR